MSADAAGRTYFDLRRSLLPAVGLPRDFLGGQVITDEHSALLADAGTRELIEQDTTPIPATEDRQRRRSSAILMSAPMSTIGPAVTSTIVTSVVMGAMRIRSAKAAI